MVQKPTPASETRNHPRNRRPNRKKHHLHQLGLEYGHEKEITHQMCHRNSGQIATPGSGDGRVSSLGRFAMGHKKDKGARRNTNHGETRDSSSVHTKQFSFFYMKAPIEFVFALKHRVPQQEKFVFRVFSVPSATTVRRFISNNRSSAHVYFRFMFVLQA